MGYVKAAVFDCPAGRLVVACDRSVVGGTFAAEALHW